MTVPLPTSFRNSPWPVRAILLVALLALFTNSWKLTKTFSWLEMERARTVEIRATVESVKDLLQSMTDAETGERGYIITGNADFLQPYHTSMARLDHQIANLDAHVALSPGLAAEWLDLKEKIHASSEFLHNAIQVRQRQGFESAVRTVESGEGKRRMDALRQLATLMIEKEEARIAESIANVSKEMDRSKTSQILLTLLDITLFGAAFVLLTRALTANAKTHATLQVMHDASVSQSEELARKQHVQLLQNKLVNVLQSSVNIAEAYQGIDCYCAQIFHVNSGALFIRNNSKDYYERVAAWGDRSLAPTGFEPSECWSARNGNIYRFDSSKTDLPCLHFDKSTVGSISYLCVPMNANGELTGIMILFGENNTASSSLPVSARVEESATEVIEKIGLAIANIRLRDTLRHNSIIDALTGLYNRRYMEETLRREIARAERVDKPIGVMMLDLDHFKRFNDTYGHDAGDLVLREAAQAMKKIARRSDFACRFGGEEFTVVMPEADTSILMARAKAIQHEIRSINLSYGGRSLGPITVSIGIAVFPHSGTTSELIVKAADDALYQAKANGRDQVVVCSSSASLKLAGPVALVG